MKKKRVIAFLLGFIMVVSAFSGMMVTQANEPKAERRIYLHAFQEEPLLTDTADRTTVYLRDTVNLALAVDKPNMAENSDEPEFNLGGFTVKIYFDTRFFDFVEPYLDPEKKTKNAAIEYSFVGDDGWSDDSIEGEVGKDEDGNPTFGESFGKPGFLPYSQGTHFKDDADGTQTHQGYAYATIFYGGTSLPYTEEDEGHWYDIARLPLIPKQTGHTTVSVDISGDDKHTLELFAKDNPNKTEIKRSFDYLAVNSGVFNITIADRSKPNPPTATPAGSTYTSPQKVRLSIDNEMDKPGKIYYTLDGSEPTENSLPYTEALDADGGIPINETKTLKAIVWREKDERISNVATHIYDIVPRTPILFNELHKPISNSYTEDWVYTEDWDEDGYKVFASDQDDFNAHISAASTLYYTFSDLSPDLISDEPGNTYVGRDAETQWVEINKDTKELKDSITKLRTVRLVNFHKTARSSVSVYYLGVKPGAVLANPEPSDVTEAPEAIELDCVAPPTADIYYTTNGANPRTNGKKYEDKIVLSSNTTITAAAFYAGVWGEIYTFPYVFTNNPPETIKAFNPPGWYEGSVGVALIPTEPGKKIFYSVDGGQVKEYTKSLILEKDAVITAYVEGDELNVQTFEYEVQPLAPEFGPEGTQLTEAEWVTIFTPGCTAGTKGDFQLKFTVDGSDPTKDTVNPTGVKYRYNEQTHEAQVYVTDKVEIKAIVVKYGEYVSDIATHKYEVITSRPAAPTLMLAPGHYTTPAGVPLSTVFKDMAGIDIYYTMGTAGVPLADPDPNNPANMYVKDSPITLTSNDETIIKAIAVKKGADGSLILSDTVVYRYEVSEVSGTIPPGSVVADKPSGTYIEGTTPHTVTLSGSDDIWYNVDGTGWQSYSQPIEIPYEKASVTLYVRDGETGTPVAYVYHFEPPAPVIRPTSGVYNGSVTVEFDFPEGDQYRRYIQQSGGGESIWQGGDFQQKYTDSVAFEVYVVNTVTGVMSKHVYRDYLITDGADLGDLYINWPYSQKRISKHLLSTDDYVKGISYGGTYGSNRILYQIKYTPNGGSETAYSPEYVYDDKLPFIPTKQMENLTIKSWIDGAMEDAFEHTIEFIDMGKPSVRVENPINSSGNYPKNTKAWVQNDHPDKESIVVFYTLNGEASDSDKSQRKWFSATAESADGDIVLANTTTIRAVYYMACGNSACDACKEKRYHECIKGNYGEEFVGVYPVVESVGGKTGGGIGGGGIGGGGIGGGGGTQVVDNTRKYTKDIFGQEHPTHIGYINGYPDGSVRPDGDITREEITAILYRITNHDYETPFVATGDAFPDVESGRWSAHDIEYMSDKKVVLGYPDGEFKPARNLTRAEFAALIFRFAGLEEAEMENPFPDLTPDHWAYKEVLALVKSGLVEGYEDGTFRPEDNISRAEVMTVVNKLLGRRPLESYVKSLHFNPYNDLEEEKWYYVTVLEATITHNYWLNETGYEYKWEDWK